MLVALASFALGARPLAGQIVSLLGAGVAAGATTILASDVARELDGELKSAPSVPTWFVPLVAGAAVAATGQLWQSGIVVMADTTGLAATTLAAVGVARYGRSRRLAWLLVAAVGIAWATISRWIYGLVAVPFAIAALTYLWHGDRRRGLFHGLVAAIVAVLIVAPVLVPALANLGGQAAFNADFQVYSWSPFNAFRREFPTADGLLSYRFPNGLYYLIAAVLPPFLAPVLVVFAPFGLVPCWHGRRSPLAVLVIGWLIVGYAFTPAHPGRTSASSWLTCRRSRSWLPSAHARRSP